MMQFVIFDDQNLLGTMTVTAMIWKRLMGFER